jgi:hypothetical protein
MLIDVKLEEMSDEGKFELKENKGSYATKQT